MSIERKKRYLNLNVLERSVEYLLHFKRDPVDRIHSSGVLRVITI